MIMPRFTIRTGLVGVAVCALIFLVAGMAVRGNMWAWGITIAMISLVVTTLVHAMWYGLAWMLSEIILPPAAPAVASSLTPPDIQAGGAADGFRVPNDEATS